MFSASAYAATPEKIHASYGAISGSMAPIWVAKEARLFEKHGLDLNLVYISGGPRSIMSLLGGSIQFVNHSGMPALEAYQRGADTALIASPMNQLEHSLVVQKNITSTEQLRGKILGMSTAASLTDILLREGLRLSGISEKDVTIIPVGDLAARLSGLQTGRVHGVIIAGIQTLTATKMGFRQLIDFSKLPIEISGSGILVRRAYVNKNPETTRKFLRGWIEGIYLLKAKAEFQSRRAKKICGDTGHRGSEHDVRPLSRSTDDQTASGRTGRKINVLSAIAHESGNPQRQPGGLCRTALHQRAGKLRLLRRVESAICEVKTGVLE